jgi:ABC-type Fe3+ transport system substrate-binding protein
MPLHDARGRWYGAAMSGFGIVWNKRVVERMSLPRVAEWKDLTNPNLYGWVASGDPTSSGSVRAVFEMILQAYGFEEGYATIVQIAGNVSAFDVGGHSSAQSVGLGQSAYGLSIDIYAYEEVASGGPENIGFIMPSRLTVITPDPIAVIRGAPHPELARRFVGYVLSEPGQKLWYVKVGSPGGPERYGLNRLPVLRSLYGSDLPTGVTVNPFTWDAGFDYDEELDNRRRGILGDFLRASVLDCHSELRRAWRAVIDAGEKPSLVRRLGESPVSGEELLELAPTWWADTALRQRNMREWSDFARRKFREVREAAR